MRRIAAAISLVFLGATLMPISSFPAVAAPMITTCTDFVKDKTIVLKEDKENCRPFQAAAIWRTEQSDTSINSGEASAKLKVCSSQNPLFSYKFIKSKCPKFQTATDYRRAVVKPETPLVLTAAANGHSAASILLATDTSTARNYAPISYFLVTNLKSNEISRVAPDVLNRLLISGLSSLTTYTFQIAAVNIDGVSPQSLITTEIRTTAVPVTASAPATAPPTSVVVYAVGDRGPGGGIVFYVSPAPFTSAGSTCNAECKYLEVAPAGWKNGGVVVNDPSLDWSSDATTVTGQDLATVSSEGVAANILDEKLNWKLGQGFYNTSVMKVAGATSDAQAAVLAYAGGSMAGQWFIPSMNELNELCKYARGQTTGDLTVACTDSGTLKTGTTNDLAGFVGNGYWSSSEETDANARFQYFGDGYPDVDRKDRDDRYLRPIRAF
jgi:hypothetical protein